MTVRWVYSASARSRPGVPILSSPETLGAVVARNICFHPAVAILLKLVKHQVVNHGHRNTQSGSNYLKANSLSLEGSFVLKSLFCRRKDGQRSPIIFGFHFELGGHWDRRISQFVHLGVKLIPSMGLYVSSEQALEGDSDMPPPIGLPKSDVFQFDPAEYERLREKWQREGRTEMIGGSLRPPTEAALLFGVRVKEEPLPG